MKNTGSIKLKITFKTSRSLSDPLFKALRDLMLELANNYQVVFDDFRYSDEVFIFSVKYKINQNITGILNNIKTVTSRKIKDHLKSDNPIDLNLPMVGFSQVRSIKKTKKAFWEQGYCYEVFCPDPPFITERKK